MKDPYEVLGISRTASDSEIKKAYHDLVKKYHPDNYVNNPLADLASEKMKEINEAYDTVTRERPGQRGCQSRPSYQREDDYRSDASYRAESYQSRRDDQGSQSDNHATYTRARAYINASQLDAAESILIHVVNRDAEWYYLKGVIAYRRGWLDLARQNYQTACAMVPGNYEYQNALRSVQSGYTPYRQQNYGASDMDAACDLCNALLCLNCLCGGCR